MESTSGDEDRSFVEWQSISAANNTASVAAMEYYDDETELHPYTVRVGGQERVYPVFTTPGWRSSATFDEIVDVADGTHGSGIDDRVLQQIAESLAHRNDESVREAAITDHLWNGDVFTPVSGSLDSPRFTVVESSYFEHLSTIYPLVEEIQRELFDFGLAPDADRREIRNAMQDVSLPVRSERAGSLSAGVTEQSELVRLIGVSTLVVVNSPDGHKLLIPRRNDTVRSSPRQYGMIGGVYDQESESLEMHVLREFVEELLNAEEGADPLSHPMGVRAAELIDSGGVHLEYLNTVVDALRTSLHVRGMLYIEDEEFGRNLLESVETNFEAAEMYTIPLDDGERLSRISTVDSMSVSSAPCLFDGLARLEGEYGIASGLDFDVVVE